MSHFFLTVLMPAGSKIADADDYVERALAPFEEFGANGTESEHVKEIDVTDEHRTDFANADYAKGRTFMEFCESWNEYKAVPHGEAPDLEDKHKWGYTKLDSAGEVVQVISRTNPNAKWDWWVIGGRWDRALLGSAYRDNNNPYGGKSDTCGNVVPVAELPNDFKAFAFLTPSGEWIERGKMGWWGSVSDEKDEKAWKAVCKTVLEKHADCIAVGVDCHS